MAHVFEVLDVSGRIIRLTHERWNHIVQEHPEIGDPEPLQHALVHPLTISTSARQQNVKWYYVYKKKLARYLMVAVKYLNGDGYVITAFYMRTIR